MHNVVGVDLGSYKSIISRNNESLQIFHGDREARSMVGMQQSGVRVFFQENQIKKSMIEHLVLSPLQLLVEQPLLDNWLFFGQHQSGLLTLREESFSKIQVVVMFLVETHKQIN